MSVLLLQNHTQLEPSVFSEVAFLHTTHAFCLLSNTQMGENLLGSPSYLQIQAILQNDKISSVL